jgi:hypothetical protein
MATTEDRNVYTLYSEEQAWAWARGEAELLAKHGRIPGMTVDTLEVADENLPRMQAALVKLQKLAAKHGQTPPAMVPCGLAHPVKVKVHDERDPETGLCVPTERTQIRRVVVTLTPDTLGFEGWRIVAKLTWIGTERVVLNFPGETFPNFTQFHTCECEHCRTRRRRNDTYIVARQIEGVALNVYKQVGGDCLREFMGIDPAYALALAGYYQATGEASVGTRYEEPLQPWLEWVAMAVRLDGRYWSKDATEAEKQRRYEQAHDGREYGARTQQTTADHARTLGNVAEYDAMASGTRNPALYPNDDDRAIVAKVREYVATLDPSMSSYQSNLRAIFKSDILVQGLHGIAASAFSGYLREQARVAEAASRATMRPSEYLGAQGDRVTIRARVATIREYDSAFGTTWIYGFVTAEGDKATWFSSNDMELNAGDTVTVTGRIKKLEEYRGERQTVLTRCKVAR